MSNPFRDLTSTQASIKNHLSGLQHQEKVANQMIGELKGVDVHTDAIVKINMTSGLPVASISGQLTNQLDMIIYPEEMPAIIKMLEGLRNARSKERDAFESNFEDLMQKAAAIDEITDSLREHNCLK